MVPVGSGDTFIAAMQQGAIDAGMTSEPTISRLLKTGQAKILVDMRSAELTRQVLGGVYPAACLYMQSEWVDAHHDDVQKLANAFVKTLRYIANHSAEEIAAHVPKDYYVLCMSRNLSTTLDRKPPGPGAVSWALVASRLDP